MAVQGALARRIRLLLADVDGTLLTPDKVLTARARQAVARWQAAGLAFAITSGRPPRGMRSVAEPLAVTTPMAGFNGGVIVAPDQSVMAARYLAAAMVEVTLRTLRDHGLDVWVYAGDDWHVGRADAPHVAREAATVGFDPIVDDGATAARPRVVKLVGVSDDAARMTAAEAAMQAALGDGATVVRSQPYYLDITHKDANKGGVVQFLARHYGLDPEEIATIGDQANDIAMFRASGLGIAMGNADDRVREAAHMVTEGNTEDGFAAAVETLLRVRE